MKLFEIEYQFDDELLEDKHRYGYVVAYGDYADDDYELNNALTALSETDDASELDKVLKRYFDLTDEDIVFYLCCDYRDELSIPVLLQSEMGAMIYDIHQCDKKDY